MRIECKPRDLHDAIDEAWRGERATCTECGQAHGGWCPSLEPAHPATCPECEGINVSESGSCFDCRASDYFDCQASDCLEEEK